MAPTTNEAAATTAIPASIPPPIIPPIAANPEVIPAADKPATTPEAEIKLIIHDTVQADPPLAIILATKSSLSFLVIFL